MATCQDVISRALRKLNALPLGDTVSTNEATNALLSLQSGYMELVGWGSFGRENDILVSGEWTASPNQRVRVTDPNATVTIPDELPPWCEGWWNDSWPWGSWIYWPVIPTQTTSCCCQAPRDLSVVTVVDPTNGDAFTWIYDAFVGSWGILNNLTLATEAPLSRRWFEPLANMLAARLAADYGQTIPDALALQLRNSLQAMALRYGTARAPLITEYF